MNAASLPEWATAFAIGTGAFVPGALLILSLDHNLPRLPRLPRVDAATARATAGLHTAAWLLVLAWHLGQKDGAA